jgi:isoleucyl-tRNA synthetase
LINTITLAAPIIPFMTEAIYQNLKKAFIEEKKSVHHLDWPSFDPVWIDEPLEEYFEIGKQIIATSSNAREKCKLGMRWPVLKVIVESKDEKVVNAVKKLSKHLKIQLNSKDIQVFENMEGVKIKVTGNFSKIGPDFAELSPRIIAYLNTISSETILSNMKNKGSYKFKLEGKEIELKNEHLNIEKVIPDGFESAESKLGTVYLDRTRNTELDSEGFSREIVRRVQIARKDAGLNKKDRITLFIECDKELEGMIWKDHIKEKVGAEGFTLSDTSPKKDFEFTDKPRPIRGHSVKVYLDKVK